MNDDKKMKYNRFPMKFSMKEIVRHVNMLIQGQWNKFQPTVVCRSLLAYFTRPFRFNNEKERGDACSRNYLLGTPRFVLERFAHVNFNVFSLVTQSRVLGSVYENRLIMIKTLLWSLHYLFNRKLNVPYNYLNIWQLNCPYYEVPRASRLVYENSFIMITWLFSNKS